MVNNFTNINKIITSHLSPSLTEHRKRPQHTTLKIQVLAWDRHTNVVVLNRDPNPPFLYVIHCFYFLFFVYRTATFRAYRTLQGKERPKVMNGS
jgi:hypothetical protein